MRFKPFLKSAQCNTWISRSMLKIVKLIVHRELLMLQACRHIFSMIWWCLEPFAILYLESQVFEIPLLDPANIYTEKELPAYSHARSIAHPHIRSIYLYLPLIAATSVGLAQDNALKKFTSLKDCRLCCYDKSACLSICIYLIGATASTLIRNHREISQPTLIVWPNNPRGASGEKDWNHKDCWAREGINLRTWVPSIGPKSPLEVCAGFGRMIVEKRGNIIIVYPVAGKHNINWVDVIVWRPKKHVIVSLWKTTMCKIV